MAGTIKRQDPVGQIVKNLLPAGTGGQSGVIGRPWVTVTKIISSTNTATAALAWINPEAATVAAKVLYIINGSAGTGVAGFSVGRSSDGTGSGVDYFGSGTLTAGIHIRPPAASATNSAIATDMLLLGPGGVGTNNSIVGLLSDTATSTMGTLMVVINYMPVE